MNTQSSVLTNENAFYIGLMSGTSIDGIDVALVDFARGQHQLVAHYLHPIPATIKQALASLCRPLVQSEFAFPESIFNTDAFNRIELLGRVDHQMGLLFAEAVNHFLEQHGLESSSIRAIGSHGQTIRHQPAIDYAFTMQIGDPNLIAYHTGITTVADFRRMDMAAGGQGAPLAPAFHNAVMRSPQENRVVLNLGGIANITLLASDPAQPVIGFDTGTANTLMDAWFQLHFPQDPLGYDKNAELANKGQVNQVLLARLLADPYFAIAPPKSTGREYFSIEWLNRHLALIDFPISVEDIQRTLLEFSAQTIVDAIVKFGPTQSSVYACGGGQHNQLLIERLSDLLGRSVKSTDQLGVDGDYLEAMTFAWLAQQRIEQQPANLPSVTGAKQRKILGAVYLP